MTRRGQRPAIVDLAAVAAVAIAGLLVGVSLDPATRPTSVASPGASNVATGPSPGPSSRPPVNPSAPPSQPPPSPQLPPGPCQVPESIPAPPKTVAAPRIDAPRLAMVFTSYLYERSPGGQLFAQDSDARYGLWFATPGDSEARLLVATGERGAVLPLGLSPSGDTVAVWYQPEGRVWGGPACPSGIYLLSTVDGSSRLVMQRDWREALLDEPPIQPLDRVGRLWFDGQTADGDSIVHWLPEASFSANGRSVAFVERNLITVVGPGRDPLVRTHAGACRSWAWSPHGAFVAGCEQLSSAWTINVGEGYGERFYPLPLPDADGLSGGWERWWAGTIGFTPRGDIRVVRFFGFATGCEGPVDSGCSIPRPAWTVTRVEQLSGRLTSRVTRVEFLSDAGPIGRDARLAADGSWVYIRTSPSYSATSVSARARTISIDSGAIHTTQRLGDPAGGSIDGRFLFDTRVDRGRDLVLVRGMNQAGTIRDLARIAWPEGVGADAPVISTWGLAVSWLAG